MQTVTGRIYRFFLWGFGAIFLLVLLRIAVTLTKYWWLALLLSGFSAAAVLGFALLAARFQGNSLFAAMDRPEINRQAFAVIVFCIFTLQCVIGWQLRCDPTGNPAIYYDLRTLHNNAISLLTKRELCNFRYFAQYPHQLPPLLFLTAYYGVIRFLFGKVPLYAGIPLNIFLMDCGIILLYLLARRLYSRRTALAAAVLCLGFAPFYTYVPFFYMDTFSIPFTILPIYLYVCAQQTLKERARYAVPLYLCSGAAFGVGALLRSTILIPLIAVCMHLLWTHASALRRLWKPALCLLLAFAAVTFGYRTFERSQNLLTEEDLYEFQFPKTHWVMMGLKGAMWNSEDEEFTKFSGNYDQKKAATEQEIRNRLQDRGVLGTLNYLWKKMAFQWRQGTYRAGTYLSRSPAEPKGTLVHRLFLRSGSFYPVFLAYSQVYLFAVLCLFLLSLWYHLRRKVITLQSLLYITFMGVFLFFLFWEANSKYLLNFMPLFLLCSADGFCRLAKKLSLLRMKKRQAKQAVRAD